MARTLTLGALFVGLMASGAFAQTDAHEAAPGNTALLQSQKGDQKTPPVKTPPAETPPQKKGEKKGDDVKGDDAKKKDSKDDSKKKAKKDEITLWILDASGKG